MRRLYGVIVACVFIACIGVRRADAQRPVITSFHGNGELTWTNAAGTNSFVVEWASTLLNGQWHNNWADLALITATGTQHTVGVPMFYRVTVETNDYTSALSGPWFAYDQWDEDMPYFYILFNGDGAISEYGAFDEGTPPGFYSVLPNGHFCIGLLGRDRRGTTPPPYVEWQLFLTGNMDNPLHGTGEWMFVPPSWGPGRRSSFELAPVPGSTCAGTWVGTLVDTNAPPQTNDVSFAVTSTGLITNFVGFALPVSGHMFADTNANVYAFLWTGDTGDYTEIKILGTLSSNLVTGRFHLHLGPRGPVSFQRQ